MSAATATATAPARRHVPHAVIIAIAGAWILAVAVEMTGDAAWLHHDRLVEHGQPWWQGLALWLLAWQAMTVAMMLPSSLPLVRLFAHASAGQPQPRRAMVAFLGGYASAWSAFAVIALVGDVAVHRVVEASGWLHAHQWAIGGSVLALAGGFQFTSLKEACLRQCRHPAAFLLRYYERGTAGGFRLGARHGVFCVGCCWVLMLVMIAVGAANLVWMAVITALMVHEKTRPLGARGVPVTGMALLGVASVTLIYSACRAAGVV
ncbi:MAG TPA: DUF2182 domain-containing protein [Acidimicrobiales bacterium]|nr:DUF2182 domain-containing protein [Acidimicrobiales bacterium]